MKIRLLLRDLRTSRELSQEELARALNLSRQSIISLERGEYLPSSPVLLAMMEFFNCSIHDLVDGINVQVIRLNAVDDATGKILPLISEDEDLELPSTALGSWQPGYAASAGAMNIYENEREYVVEVQAMGYSEKELSLELTNNALTVSGGHQAPVDAKSPVHTEWQTNEFSRTISFKNPIDETGVEAKLENGLLTVVAPKNQPPKAKTTKIVVKKK